MTDITPSRDSIVRLLSKRHWEFVIGEQYNKNGEANHIQEQTNLNSAGYTQLGMGSRGRKK